MTPLIKSIKCWLAQFASRYDWYWLYTLRKRGYLFDMGWLESVRQKSAIDRDGNPVPWITYPSLVFIEERLKRDFVVFEYGSGNSTLWWARRVKRLVSCEHDQGWYEQVCLRIPPNVDLNHVALQYGGAYSRLVGKYPNVFDVIVVDGRDRVNCTRNALSSLKPDGVLILDNSEVADYEDALDLMRDAGFRRLDFVGPGPINILAWRTSVFYRIDNCLGI